MTLTRPVYAATVQNVTAGWSYTLTAGDVPDPTDGMWVIDPLNVSWSFSGGLVPGQLDPDVAAFSILAELAADLPECNLGDILLVNIDRPTDVDPIPYVHFAGRVRDATLLQVPGRGVTLVVNCSDFLADLASTVVPGGAFTAGQYVDDRMLDIAERAGLNIFVSTALQDLTAGIAIDPTAPGGAVAAELLIKLIQIGSRVEFPSSQAERGVYVLRSAYDPPPPVDAWAEIGVNNDTPIYYLVQSSFKAARVSELPFELTRVDNLTSAKPTSDAEDNTHMIVLSARKVPVGPSRRKSRDTAINQVSYTFYIDGNETVQLDDVVADIGPNPRSIEVSLRAATVALNDNPYLPDEASTRAWSFPDMAIPIRDDTFDDTQLDVYAPLFYPVPEPISDDHDPKLGRPVVLFGISDDVNVDSLAATGLLSGCQFNIAAGQLTLTPQVTTRNPTLGDIADVFAAELGITWADIAADPAIEPTTWADIDPDLTWSDFRLIQA